MIKITSVAVGRDEGQVGGGDGGRADRRGTRPAHARGPGQGAAAGQAGCPRRGAGRHVRFPPRGDRADAAGPGRVPGPADHPMEDQAIAALAQVPGVLGRGRDRADRPGLRHQPGLAGAGRRAPAGRDPRHQRVAGHRDHRRDRPEHGRLPHPGAPGVLDGAVPVRQPSPAPGTARASRRRATATPAPPPGRPPSAPPAPPPSSANGTPGSPAAAARPSPRPPSPAPS